MRPRAASRLMSAVATVVIVAAASIAASPAPSSAAGVADDDWLGIVNTYRAMSGLSPVTSNSTWSSQAHDHSCYMLLNGISHDEIPGNPGYTSGGDTAGNSSNVAVSSAEYATARNHIDLWMTGPFHAIGILRHNLTRSGFGICSMSSTPTPWHSGGTLDVIRGLDYSKPRPSEPIVFPGDGQTVSLNSFITEYPDPMSLCGWSGSAGLPLIAMMPSSVSSATSTLTGPSGPIETCTLHPGNTGANATAQAILGGDNAVVVMPRAALANGAYTVTVNSNGGTATWSFHVDTNAPLQVAAPDVPDAVDTAPAGATSDFVPVDPFRLVDTRQGRGASRLGAGQVVRIAAADTGVTAISANFVAVNPSGPGHLTIFNCSAEVPVVSTIGYVPGTNTANQAIVPLDHGDFCIYAHAAVDVVVDVNGYYRGSGTSSQFEPTTPVRLYDSRRIAGGRLAAHVERKVKVRGGSGAPSGADAVVLNVTSIDAPDAGHLQVYPCGATRSLETSTINYRAHEVRPNTVVVGFDTDGYVCLRSLRDLDVAIDYAGYFGVGAGYDFTPLDPIRLFDSRQPAGPLNESTAGSRVAGGQVIRLQVAGARGIPADARAASLNLTVTGSSEALHVTAYPCGTRPDTSNVNVGPGQTTANGALAKLSPTGEICIYVLHDTHLIVDISGVWS